VPKKNAPEFHYDEKKKLYRKRIKNEYTGAWVDVYGKTKQETRENVERRREEIAVAAAAKDSPFVHQYAATWFSLNTGGLSESRKDDYRNAINNHICPVIGHLQMRDVKPDDIKEVMRVASWMSKSSQQKIVTALKRIFESAEDNGIIEKSPCRSLKPGGAPPPEKTALTAAQTQTLIDAVKGTRAYLFVMIGIYAGLRREEIAALQWDCIHIDDEVPYLEVRRAVRWIKNNRAEISEILKSKKSRRNIPLAPQLKEALSAVKATASSCYVVPDANGNVMSYTSLTRLWGVIESRSTGKAVRVVDGEKREIEKKLGDKVARHNIYITIDFAVTPHMLRHTFITNLILSGANIKTVQYLAGHATIKMTLDIYTHLMENQPEDTIKAITGAYAPEGKVGGTRSRPNV